MGFGAEDNLSSAGSIGRTDARASHNDAAGREVRALDVLHQLIQTCIWIVDEAADSVDDLAEIVRRDIGSHTNRNTGGTVDQQVRESAGQNDRLLKAVIVVGFKIDRFLVDVGEHPHGNLAHLRLGVSVSSRWVSIDRTEVSVAVYQRIAQREILCHSHQRIINRSVAVRMVLTQHAADRVCTLTEGFFRVQTVAVHGV